MNRALIAATLIAAGAAVWWAMRDDAPAAVPAEPAPDPTPQAARVAVAREADAPAPAPALPPRPDAGSGTARVTVTDALGAALAGATVSALGEADPTAVSAVTGKDGVALLTLGPDRWRITAKAPGFVRGSATQPIAVGERVEVTIALEKGASVRGRVVTREGVPVPGAKVGAAWKHADQVAGSDTLTATDGSFGFDDVPAGERVRLRVSAEGFPTEEATVVPPNEQVTITLRPGQTLRVHVVEMNGQPAVGATASLFTGGAEPSPARFRGVPWRRGDKAERAGADGVATFRGVPTGSFTVYARHETTDGGDEGGFGMAQGTLGSETRDVEVRLAAGTRLRGLVVDPERRPIVGARVIVRAARQMIDSESTGDDGRFDLAVFEPGPYTLAVGADGFRISTIEDAGPETTVTLTRLETISGRVVDPTGAAVTHFDVNETKFDAADGRFQVPRSRYRTTTLEITAPGFAIAKVAVAEKQADVGDVVLSRGRTVTVTVVSSVSQKPIANADVRGPGEQLTNLVFAEPPTPSHLTGADGTVQMPSINDPATLQVLHADHVAQVVALPAGASALRVALDPGALVRVMGPGRDPLFMTQLGVRGSRVLLRERGDAVRLAPGRYALQSRPAMSPRLATVFDAVAGREVEVDVTDKGGAPLEIVTGAPVPSTTILVAVPAAYAQPPADQDLAWLLAVGAQMLTVDRVAKFPALPPGPYVLFDDRRMVRAEVRHGADAERLTPTFQGVR